MQCGIPRFVDSDGFYEGRWAANDLSAGSLRNYLVKKERFFVREMRPRPGSVLDLGCGGGWRFYTTVGPVAGIDLSHQSLVRAAGIYQCVAQSDLKALPFEDGSFDYVVSSDLLGHIPVDQKDGVVREASRVLKVGGRTLHYIETVGDDPLMRWASGYPELFKRHIEAPEGHIGMETPADTARRFRRMGLRPLVERPVYRGLTYVGRYLLYFDNEYKYLARSIRVLVGVCRRANSNQLLGATANVLVSGLIEALDPVLPASWAGGILVSYEKTG